MSKESAVGNGCSGELPFVFEMSQALMVILVEYSGKVGVSFLSNYLLFSHGRQT